MKTKVLSMTFFAVLMMLLGGTMMTACGSKGLSDVDEDNPFVGVWKSERATLTLNGDGTGTYSDPDGKMEFGWEVNEEPSGLGLTVTVKGKEEKEEWHVSWFEASEDKSEKAGMAIAIGKKPEDLFIRQPQ